MVKAVSDQKIISVFLVFKSKIFFGFFGQEDQRIEKVSKRSTDLDTACNNARLLAEMVSQFDKNSTAEQEIEIMKVCFA